MSLKKLLPLLALLGALVVIAVVQKRPPGSANLADEAGLIALPTTALDADDIQGIDIHYGSNRQEALRLRRQDSGWVAASYYNAPVQGAKINKLIRVLTHLQGEFRSDKAELLKNFQLASGQAYHLRIFTQSLAQSAVHLLVGKRNSAIGFVRLEDDTRVYSVSSDLFSVLDLQPDQAGGPPATKAWLDLQLQNIADQAVETFTLRTPQRTWQFRRSRPGTPNKAGSTPTKPEQPQWVLTNPSVDFPLQQSHVDGLLSTLRTLRAEDIAAADQSEATGLINPAYAATVSWRTAADGLQTSIISIGHEVPHQKDKRYARRGDSGPVYILPAWSFKRLFPKPDQFLDWPRFDTQPDALQRITLSTSDRTVQFDREGPPTSQDSPAPPSSNWHLTRPAVDFEFQQDHFDAWVKRLTRFSPDDLLPESFKHDTPQQTTGPTIDIELVNSTHYTLRLGPVIDELAQRHVLSFNNLATAFAITDATHRDIFPRLKEILILRPLHTPPDDVIRLTWQIGPQRWRLERSRIGAWRMVDSKQADIDQRQVETALRQIIDLTAEDWVETPQQAWHDAEQTLILSLGFPGDRMIQLTFMKRDTSIGLEYSNLPGLFILSEVNYTSLQASLTACSVASTTLSAPVKLQP